MLLRFARESFLRAYQSAGLSYERSQRWRVLLQRTWKLFTVGLPIPQADRSIYMFCTRLVEFPVSGHLISSHLILFREIRSASYPSSDISWRRSNSKGGYVRDSERHHFTDHQSRHVSHNFHSLQTMPTHTCSPDHRARVRGSHSPNSYQQRSKYTLPILSSMVADVQHGMAVGLMS